MKNSSTRFNWKHLWQAALVLPVSIGSLSLASQAATVNTATADFDPAVVDLTCEFSGGEGGQLALSDDKQTISTVEGTGAAPAAFTVTTNVQGGGVLLAETPTLTRSAGTLQQLILSSPVLNGVQQTSFNLTEGANSINVGASFTAEVVFEAGTYDTSVALTCTDNGIPD